MSCQLINAIHFIALLNSHSLTVLQTIYFYEFQVYLFTQENYRYCYNNILLKMSIVTTHLFLYRTVCSFK